jgi:hypothetical protein
VNVLSDYCKRIDLVDSIDRFIGTAGQERTAIGIAVDKVTTSAQDGTPDKHYDAFWCSSGAMWLLDDDLVAFFNIAENT